MKRSLIRLPDNSYDHFSALYDEAGFDRFDNLADASLEMAFLPRIVGADDGQMISAAVGRYKPNAWGLYDMHGNVAEWTLSDWKPYPYVANHGRNDADAIRRKVVRGGSWRDRPHRARSAFRLAYEPYQRVFNVGFRVVCGENGSAITFPRSAARDGEVE